MLVAPKPRRGPPDNARNLLWVVPVFLVLACFLIYPLANGLLMSLQRTTGAGPSELVGIDNYVEALSSKVQKYRTSPLAQYDLRTASLG